MTKFTTISPTHVPGKKEYAWNKFKEGNYVAIGWTDEDFTGKSIEEVTKIIESSDFENEYEAIKSFEKFLSLNIGDIVCVNNVNFGLYGVGKITSEYKYEECMHDTGSEDEDQFYSHFYDVDWLITSYLRRENLLEKKEKGWQPYGTIGKVYDEIPIYIKRLLGEPISSENSIEIIKPIEFENIIKTIENLKSDPSHSERGHESLVEDFLVILGYEKQKDIKYRRGRMDISISLEDMILATIEVKRDWNLNTINDYGAVDQAYGYALENGARYIIITNGDYYAIYDRLKGLSYRKNYVGEFKLTTLEKESLELIDEIRKDNLLKSNLRETLLRISESFEPQE